MAKKRVDFSINLVPKDPFFNTYLGKTLKWALSVGRYIVIFTEITVIVSFITRFSLDRQVTDLNNSIFQKSTIIESFGDLEQNVRETQAKIDHYQQIEQQENITEIFPVLSQITPRDVSLDQLTIKADSITLTGRSLSQQSFSLLITNMQLSPVFFDIDIRKVETKDSNSEDEQGFEFSLAAKTNTP